MVGVPERVWDRQKILRCGESDPTNRSFRW